MQIQETYVLAAPDSPDCCALILTLLSYLLIMVTLPVSLCMCIKVIPHLLSLLPLTLLLQVVQEYERAVIFRLGRLLSGGARGPGVFFIIPCVDVYEKIDMRTQTYEIPPQEVNIQD